MTTEPLPYHIDEDFDDTHAMLVGPDGFQCRLGEPEDRIWSRDGQDAVDCLNAQHGTIESLRTALAAEQERARGLEGRAAHADAQLASVEPVLYRTQHERDAADADVERVARWLMYAWAGGPPINAPGDKWLDTARAAIAAGLDPRRVP